MIALPLQIIIALVLDVLIGDPRWLPHPVQAIGALALALEMPLKKRILNPQLAGAIAVIIVIASTAGSCALLLWLGALIHPIVHDCIAIILLYTTCAARSLTDHAQAVLQPLREHNLPVARQQVAQLVGRDTAHLDEAEISRATVESVAENSVDGVTAPLLFAMCGGPILAMVYKAINTLDSTFGYKNERYLNFGRTAARLDDAANFIPARLTALLVIPAAWLLKLDYKQAWRIFRRDRNNHPSPNGGQIEAAMAGALNVQLGGNNRYFGENSFRPYMGNDNAGQQLCARHIAEVIKLMWVCSSLVAIIGISIITLLHPAGY